MSNNKGKMTAQELFDEAFSGHRDKRSYEYKEGVMATLKFRLGDKASIFGGYAPGSPQNDAFSAGCEEGHAIARKYHRGVRYKSVAMDTPKRHGDRPKTYTITGKIERKVLHRGFVRVNGDQYDTKLKPGTVVTLFVEGESGESVFLCHPDGQRELLSPRRVSLGTSVSILDARKMGSISLLHGIPMRSDSQQTCDKCPRLGNPESSKDPSEL